MTRRRYVVGYDIRQDKRLRRVHKSMKGFGYPLQYSVFICDLDAMEKTAMFEEIGAIINHAVDSVAVVDVGAADSRGQECFEFMGTRRSLPQRGPRIV